MVTYVRKQFPCIDIRGDTYFSRGEQYGRALQGQIAAGIGTYTEFFQRKYGLSEQAVLRAAGAYITPVSRHLPDLLAAAEGIAAGAGVTVEQIMLLNCRYEMTKEKFPRECTTAAVLPKASRDGHTFIVKNWDYRPGILDHIVLVRVERPDGSRIFGLTEAGQLIREGFNSWGIGICSNAIRSVLDGRLAGVPVTFIRHGALECRDFDSALRRLTDLPRGVSNHTILAGGGRAVGVESFPGKTGVYHPVAGVICHANHIVTHPDLEGDEQEPKFRDARLQYLLQRRNGRIGLDYIMECMRDHAEYPQSICCHENYPGQHPMDGYMTVAGMITDLDEGKAYVCYGNPCIGEYVGYGI